MPTKSWSFYGPDQWRDRFAGISAYPWAEVPIEGLEPGVVLVCLGSAENGRLICTGLLVDPTKNVEITSRLLRDVRLGEILAWAAEAPLPLGRVRTPALRRVRPGRHGYPLAHYKRVAAAYKQALLTHPKTPIRRLITELSASEATVHRWLSRCIELGLLDQRRGKRGSHD
ncbi:MAG: hypothetical protein M3R48_05065 [Candidatus Dormibacteraeota bacterium]|nr:hypothetical protein [Candidatus Dormibacteraeota bacterium]